MDKTCSIVQDLLPLYEEDMTDDNSASGIDGALRKVREIYRALCLSRSYSKETILEAYLNTISFTGPAGPPPAPQWPRPALPHRRRRFPPPA